MFPDAAPPGPHSPASAQDNVSGHRSPRLRAIALMDAAVECIVRQAIARGKRSGLEEVALDLLVEACRLVESIP
jgi:hypothetical protein